jgi:hypothetical protein
MSAISADRSAIVIIIANNDVLFNFLVSKIRAQLGGVDTDPVLLEEVLTGSVDSKGQRINVVAVAIDVLCCLGNLPEAVESVLVIILSKIWLLVRREKEEEKRTPWETVEEVAKSGKGGLD